jgi:hypothetical protein
MPPVSLLALAGVLPAMLCCQTATAADWGEDLLILRGGTEVMCTVLSMDDDQVATQTDGMPVTFERRRIERILLRGGQVSRRLQAPAATASGHPRHAAPATARQTLPAAWSLSAGLAAGWVWGSVDSDGILHDGVTNLDHDWSSTVDLAGAGALPGAQVRLLWWPDPGSGASSIGGLQAQIGQTEGGDAAYRQHAFSVLAGVGWRLASADVALLAKGGYAAGTFDRSMRIATGAFSEEVDLVTGLTGWTAGLELSATRPLGRWDVGLAGGMDIARLKGTESWASPSGRLSAVEDVNADITCLYAALSIGMTW